MAIVDAPFVGETHPVALKHDPELKDALLKYRSWFEEVRSGRKTFSFVGEKVGYRFLADGSWESVAIVNSPKFAPTPMPELGAIEVEEESPSTSDSKGQFWSWAVGLTATFGLTCVWLWKRKAVGG
jgi:hypothetical protein